MGDVRPGLGSPFQISFPGTDESSPLPPSGIIPLAREPLNCADSPLDSRCACVDCPEVCASLPYVAPPRSPNSPQCTVGSVSCLTFSLLIIYSVAILFGLSAYSWKLSVRHRQKRYERVRLLSEPPLSPANGHETGSNPFSHSGQSSTHGIDGLVGRGDSSNDLDADSGPSNYRLGRGASLLDPMEQLQPKQSKVNAVLRKFFYRLGWTCARRPCESTQSRHWLTFKWKLLHWLRWSSRLSISGGDSSKSKPILYGFGYRRLALRQLKSTSSTTLSALSTDLNRSLSWVHHLPPWNQLPCHRRMYYPHQLLCYRTQPSIGG
jgi:hypothetical protein